MTAIARPRERRVGRWAAAAVAALLAGTLLPVAAPSAGAATQADGCFVMRSYQVFLDRDADAHEIQWWTAAFASGQPHHRLSNDLAASDEWLSVEVAKVYRRALDRDPDAAGLAHWVGRLRAGAMVTAIASLVYGSDEFHQRSGGTDAGFVDALYDRILDRDPDPAGAAFWRDETARIGRDLVAGRFFASPESRADRVTALYQDLLGRAPDAAGLAHWVDQLLRVNDVRLAVLLASSSEFHERAQPGCDLPPPPPPPPATYTVSGRGWGHGRGMGQHGALGYALDHGWSGTQILDHFYGGTSMVQRPVDVEQRVYLQASNGRPLVVQQTAQRLRVDGHAGEVGAVRITRVGANSFRVERSTGCGAGAQWTLVGTRGGPVRVWTDLRQGDEPANMLQHCVDGGVRYYRGSLSAVEALGTIVTVNTLATEQVLRGIVPNEVPANWADLGGGRGANAVRAQAVAARSYLLAGDTRWGTWATTCDSAQCQVYRGHGFRATGSSTITRADHDRTDAAVLATERTVRQRPGGAIARTEFSSSTGGWTAGGDFPAVQDLGDSVAQNANHTWTATLTRDQIETAFDQRQGRDMGAFQGFDDYQRNGLGPMGGRVNSVRARFTGGDVTVTGDQLRLLFGLRSNWFTVTG